MSKAATEQNDSAIPFLPKPEVQLPARHTRGQLMKAYRATGLSEDMVRSLRKSFAGFANLYGSISIRDAYTVLKGAMKDPPPPDKFRAFARAARHDGPYRVLRDDECFQDFEGTKEGRQLWIVHGSLVQPDKRHLYTIVRIQQKRKPLHMAKLSELHRHARDFYLEKTPELWALVETLRKYSTKDDIDIMEDVAMLHQRMQMTLGSYNEDEQMEYLAEKRLVDPTRLSSEERADVLQRVWEFSLNTPCWANRGFTPEKLMKRILNGIFSGEYDVALPIDLVDGMRGIIESTTDLPGEERDILLKRLDELAENASGANG